MSEFRLSNTANIFRVKVFLTAPTPEGLVRAQLENNLEKGAEFSYEVMYDPKGKRWLAWYLEEIDKSQFFDKLEEMRKKIGGKDAT